MLTQRSSVDYSLYLVTGRTLVPPGMDYYQSVEQAIKGGVTIVQVREKNACTRDFLEIAMKTKEICHKYNVPMLINDRLDIALAAGADGVHLGQTDMPINLARSLLSPGSIIGVSANTPEEALEAVTDGADYIGVGPIWDTQTKDDIKNILGVRGVREILEVLEGSHTKAVGIAGITERNILRTLHGAVTPSGRTLDGVAVVSVIMTSLQPVEVARALSRIVRAFRSASPPVFSSPSNVRLQSRGIIYAAASLLSKIRESSPLIHQITNTVVTTQSANVTLALGASPIMATAIQEMEDLSKASSALLVNFGTIGDKSGMLEAGKWVNAKHNPIVFDPVGVGATKYRLNTALELLDAWQTSVIKGNPAEIGALAKSAEVKSRGVDSVGDGLSDPLRTLGLLARKERCIVAMTGKKDWVSDGSIALSSTNGHGILAHITGSGCIVGTSVATFCAAAAANTSTDDDDASRRIVRGDMFLGAIGGILAITVASELAVEKHEVKGTGTFLPVLIDELFHLTPEMIVERAKIELH